MLIQTGIPWKRNSTPKVNPLLGSEQTITTINPRIAATPAMNSGILSQVTSEKYTAAPVVATSSARRLNCGGRDSGGSEQRDEFVNGQVRRGYQ